MSMIEHIIDEIKEITQEEIDIIHSEIHKITERDREGIEGEEESKDCKHFDKVATLYSNWIEAIALNTRFDDVLEHLENHIQKHTPQTPEDRKRWRLSFINLFNILSKQTEHDIKEQCQIIYKKALEYQENFNDDGDYFENDYIESYKKLLVEVVAVHDA